METVKRLLKQLLVAAMLIAASSAAARAGINVVVSIKPVHSLVAAVMDGVGQPGLIVQGAGSPHTYAMKPSQAAMLQSADIVFWIGHDLEAFLEKPLANIASRAASVELIETNDLIKLKLRDHGKETEVTAEHAHGQDEFNPHVWLDPLNAKILVRHIAEVLVNADPVNAEKYRSNAGSVGSRLDALTAEVAADLAPLKDKGFVVFHDAYQNFEMRFGLSSSGSITVSPEVLPGAERLRELRARLRQLGAACVFSEPQFEPKLVATVIEGTTARSGVLDPLGALLDDGPDLYFALIRNMAATFKACMTGSG